MYICTATKQEKMIIDKTYFTHTSIFHLDDVTGCSICELSGRTEFIVRTHDINQLGDLGVKGDYGKKYDPNNDYYDHHQTEMYREDGYMFATAGLVWKHYGKEAIVNIIEEPLSDDMIDEIHQSIDRRLMKGIDAVDADNSFKTKSYCAGGEVKVMNISEMFGYLNSDDINDNDLEFYSAKELMKKIIIKMVDFSYKYIKAKSEFYDNLNIENGVAIASKNFPWRSLVHEHNDNNKDNPIYLGKSIRHHCPSDVIVISITEQQKAQLDRVYSTPIEILAPEDSPEDRFQYENEIRNELAIELAKSFI